MHHCDKLKNKISQLKKFNQITRKFFLPHQKIKSRYTRRFPTTLEREQRDKLFVLVILRCRSKNINWKSLIFLFSILTAAVKL